MSKVWIDAGAFLENAEGKVHVFKHNINRNEQECSINLYKLNSKGQGRKSKKIKCFNINTGEVKEFLGGIEASEYLNVSLSYIFRLVKENKVTSHGWKVKYV
ncbi:hypothetical protein CDIF100009_03975 (plasmid) [Clostridioides difficile]|nr:hypothetical protein [Clostridioides difficile]